MFDLVFIRIIPPEKEKVNAGALTVFAFVRSDRKQDCTIAAGNPCGARSPRGQVGWRVYVAAFRSRFGLDCALRAPLRMTWLKRCTLGLKRINIIKRRVRPYNNVIPRERSDRGNLAEAETGVSATNGSYNNYSCSLVLVSVAGDFSAVSHRGQVFGLVVSDSFRFLCREFLD